MDSLDNRTFENYKIIHKTLTFVYKGYRIEEILAIRSWFFCQNKSRQKASFKMRKSYGSLFQLSKDNLMIYGKYGRKDHEYTFDCVHKRLEDKFDSIKLDHYPDTQSLSIKNVLLAFWFIFIHVKTEAISFKNKIYWARCFCYIFNTIDYLESMPEKKIKNLLCFSAIHEDENILKQYFKKHGATTYSMFHGTNIQQVHNITIDCLTYENLDVDYSLPWGQYGKDEFIKTGFPEKKLVVVGYPRDIKLQPLNGQSLFNRCILLMSRSLFESSDIKLMQILSKIPDIHFSIKLHPTCNEQKFLNLCKEFGMSLIPKTTLLSDCLDNNLYDFAVAVNTTSYYEALVAGLPCLRFKDGNRYDMMYGSIYDEFETKNGFLKSLEWLKESKKSNEYSQVRTNLLEYCLGIGIDKYREVLI